MRVPVVIFQTGNDPVRICRRFLEVGHLIEEVDFILTDNLDHAEMAVKGGESQMLITASFDGAEDLVRRMKDKNPLVKAVSFANLDVEVTSSVWDLVISRRERHAYRRLVREVQGFLVAPRRF